MGKEFTKKFNVLIVDDSEQFAKTLKQMVIAFFADKVEEVFCAFNGEQAVAMCQNCNIDIVFMDYRMPVMNGAEATKLISKQNRFIKIVALSFNSDIESVQVMLENGALGYLVKDELKVESLGRYFNPTF